MNGNHRHLATLLLALCILSALVALTLPQGTTKPVLAETDDDHWLYLPIVAKPASSIIGHVTLNGAPVANAPLDLVFFDGENWEIPTRATTDAQGEYEFRGLDPLKSGESYHVWYTANKADRIGSWVTPQITELPVGATAQNETFDIAWVDSEMQPAYGSTVPLPITFTWHLRSALPAETYELRIQTGIGDLAGPGPAATEWAYFETGPLGHVNSYTLTELPPGFEYGADYMWWVMVYSPTAGTGTTWWHPIVFTAPG